MIWGDYVVHALKNGDKRSYLLGSQGRLTRLRIRALRFQKAEAETAAKDLSAANPDYTFKATRVRSRLTPAQRAIVRSAEAAATEAKR